MRYTELIDVDYDEENALRTITIKYNENYTNGTTKYYRIGETREWQEYTGPITLNDSDIDLNDIKKGTNKLAIYAKQMVGEGTVSISECEEEITTTVKLDVFNDVRLSGKTLNEYGFTASWSGSAHNAFSIGNFYSGRTSGTGNWAGNFIWSNPKIYGATQLYVDFYQWSQAQGSAVSNSKTQINVSYNDGITSNKSNSILYGTVFYNVPWVHLPLTIDLTSDDINYIQFYMNRI